MRTLFPLRFLQAARQFIRAARFSPTSPRSLRGYWEKREAIAIYPILPRKYSGGVRASELYQMLHEMNRLKRAYVPSDISRHRPFHLFRRAHFERPLVIEGRQKATFCKKREKPEWSTIENAKNEKVLRI